MLTDGACNGVMANVTLLLFAVGDVAQAELLVITTEIISPLAKEDDVKVEAV